MQRQPTQTDGWMDAVPPPAPASLVAPSIHHRLPPSILYLSLLDPPVCSYHPRLDRLEGLTTLRPNNLDLHFNIMSKWANAPDRIIAGAQPLRKLLGKRRWEKGIQGTK